MWVLILYLGSRKNNTSEDASWHVHNGMYRHRYLLAFPILLEDRRIGFGNVSPDEELGHVVRVGHAPTLVAALQRTLDFLQIFLEIVSNTQIFLEDSKSLRD
jgi:hypothetical protein